MALLHQKELVLNQQDTSNILDAVKHMRAIITPGRGTSSVASSSMSSNETIVVNGVNLNFDNFRGTSNEAKQLASTFINEMKKRK